MSKWAAPELGRYERELMARILDERIGRDHGVRVLDEFLRGVCWREWEAAYRTDGAGRPAIHPRLMCGMILYGLIKGIDTLRGLEEATAMRLDFQWLLEGHQGIDHATIGSFKKRFEVKIATLVGAINRRAAQMRKATLEEVVIDGTRLRADSDRHGARTAASLEKRIREVDALLLKRLEQLGEELQQQEPSQPGEEQTLGLEPKAEAQEKPETDRAGGEREEGNQERRRLEAKRATLQRALDEARRRDEIKRARHGKKAKAVRVPVSDPEAHLMPNKEGGFAPNYTPVAAVEPVSGMIVAGEVAEGHNEASTVCGLVEAVAEVYGRKPQRVLFDGNFATGETLQVLEEHGVEVYAACRGADPHNPAYREDGRAPVDPAKVEGLPMRLGKFERAAFLWDEQEHCFHCPAGRRLEYAQTLRRKEADGAVTESRVYRCLDCGGCPHASRCLGGKATTRSVSRDQYQPLRDKLAQRMRTEEGRSIYARRAPVAEGPIGTIKAAMGIRRFRRRGLAKVRADWQLICAAFNLKKLMRAFANAPTGSGSGPSAPPTPLGGALWLRIRRWWHQRRPPRRPALNFLRVPAPVAAGA